MFSDVLELMPTTTITYIIFDKMEHVTDSFSCFMSKPLSCFATQKSFRLTQTFELKEIKADQYSETEFNHSGCPILI